MNYDEKKFIEYFYALKTMDVYHKELFGNDKDFEVPQLFSQEIVKHFLGLQDYRGKGKFYDAEKDGLLYEIKATSSCDGATTLNFKEKANVLVWIKFDFRKDEFEIKELDGFRELKTMEEFYTVEAIKHRRKNASNLFDSKKRETVTLNNVKWKKSNKYNIQSKIQPIEK